MKKLFIFDLDFTLWDAGGTWCDCTTPPYHWRDGKLLDHMGHHIRLYTDVTEVLQNLKEKNKLLAVASRTHEPEWAKQLIEKLGIDHYFHFKEIYPGSKIAHLNKIKNDSGIEFQEMVFFDDEYRNIEDATRLGIESIFVRSGIKAELVNKFL